jgi:hypothetical protein
MEVHQTGDVSADRQVSDFARVQIPLIRYERHSQRPVLWLAAPASGVIQVSIARDPSQIDHRTSLLELEAFRGAQPMRLRRFYSPWNFFYNLTLFEASTVAAMQAESKVKGKESREVCLDVRMTPANLAASLCTHPYECSLFPFTAEAVEGGFTDTFADLTRV